VDTEVRKSAAHAVVQFLWLSIPFYNLSLILTKFSALKLYARMFRNHTFLLFVHAFMGILGITGIWIVLSDFFFCIPIHDFWTLPLNAKSKHCLPHGPIWFLNAGIQIVTDFAILLLPMPALRRLKLPNQQKIGIIFVFALWIL
jgi:hypothetical protein